MRKSLLLQHPGKDAARRIFNMHRAVLVILGIACSAFAAQDGPRPGDLILEDVIAPTAAGSRLLVKFMLPVPDAVSSIDVSAGGTPIDKDKVNFTPAEKAQDFRCAVLLLVDKALGESPESNRGSREKLHDVQESVRATLRKLIPAAANGPFQFGIATYSATNVVVLAAIQSNNASFLEQAVLPKYLKFDSQDPELLYHGAKEAIVKSLGTIQADRRFLIIISDGITRDTADSEEDVVKAARDARVHICTIGFPKSLTEADQIERLARLAEQTGGLAWSAEGSELSLPTGWDSNLLKFMSSGGRCEVNLTGRTAPVDLAFKVKTNADRIFTLAYTLESLPSPLPSPGTSSTPVAAASPGTSPTSISAPSATPIPSASATPSPTLFWAWLPGRLKTHLPLAAGAGIALLLVLALILWWVVRAVRKPKAEISDDMTVLSSETASPTTEVTSVPTPSEPVLAWLVNLDADSTRHPITKTAMRIGRKQDNDLVMKNDTVSGHHAEILRRGDKFMIADLGASNGVFVRGKRVEKTPLENGDIIELGEVRLRFTLNPSDE
jgi:hypothetical protein